jgi:hypothetical protein
MGIRFKQMERLPVNSTDLKFNVATGKIDPAGETLAAGTGRECIAFQKSGILLAVAKDVTGRVDELADMHYSNQVYFSMSMGSARMEEVKVMKVSVKEA